MGMTETLRAANEPRLAELDDEQARKVYEKFVGTRQLDAALRLCDFEDRQSLSYGEVRSVLNQLAGTAWMGRALDELFGEV